MNTESYDVVVIGGGTAGSNAARTAGGLGKKTLMIHREDLQNLCIERGCMPSKSMLASSEALYHARHLTQYGIEGEANDLSPNLEKIFARRDEQVARFMRALNSKIESDPYERVIGTARFLPDDQGVEITLPSGELRVVYGKRYVVATGTTPFVPAWPGLADVSYLTSDEVMQNRLTSIPASIAIVGAGAIGLEFATFFAGLGVKVTLVNRTNLLPFVDPEFGEELERSLAAMGMTVRCGYDVEEVVPDRGGIELRLSQGTNKESVQAETLLVATGRAPQLAGLGLEAMGVELTKSGAIACTEERCTNNERVFAAGDVTAELPLLHVAEAEGKVAGYNAAVGSPEKRVDHDLLHMAIIFCEPTFAHVGLSEATARERGLPYVTHTIRFPETGRAIVMGVEFGLWKLVVHKESGQILGSTILGPRADDLIHLVHLAMSTEKSVTDLHELYAYHPTLSEQFMKLLRETAKLVEHNS